MNIGIFDSGLGGLIIMNALVGAMPEYSYVYMGDTLHVPYGVRSHDAVYGFARACIDRMFRDMDCAIIIIACNTATIAALRKLQQEYLPKNFPDRRILGVVIPTVEVAIDAGAKRIGLLATETTARSDIYLAELRKLDDKIELFSVAAPLLVPLIENDGDKFAPPVLEEYVAKFQGRNLDALILGCTHFPHYKKEIRALMPGVRVLSQDEIIPEKLADYLRRHPEMESRIAKTGARKFFATDISESYRTQARRLFGKDIEIKKI